MGMKRYRAPGAELPTDADRALIAEVRSRRVDREAYARACEPPTTAERARTRTILRARQGLPPLDYHQALPTPEELDILDAPDLLTKIRRVFLGRVRATPAFGPTPPSLPDEERG